MPRAAAAARDRTFRTGSLGLLPGFQETTAFGGLNAPTMVRFSSDGRVFVAQKRGNILVYDGLERRPRRRRPATKVHNFWDRGLLGMALDPDFPAEPYVYVLYTYDARSAGGAALGRAERT